MYNVKRLMKVAREGLMDMVPAVRQAFNDDPTDDRLDQVYGSSPRATILAVAVGGIVFGVLFSSLTPEFEFKDFIYWPAVFVGLLYAVIIRRYLFASKGAAVSDFPWLAASLVPAIILLIVVSVISTIATESPGDSSSSLWVILGFFLVSVTNALGVAAALTIAVAALCFSRNWIHAFWDLALRLLVFKLMVWVTVLILLEIGIVGPIVSALFEEILGWRIPEWLPELADQISYTGLMTLVYLAVIGATWTVCRKSFAELLETGHVHILATIVQLAKDPEKKKKRKEKKEKRKEQRESAKKR